jgi:predicted nuclease with RNAse H fold
MKSTIYIGIDVAFAKNKILPVCAVMAPPGKLVPIRVSNTELPLLPRGRGNVATMNAALVAEFVLQVRQWLNELERKFGAPIGVIAIDAPASYSLGGRRKCEQAMDARGISCFGTPTRLNFEGIRQKVQAHLRNGGVESRLPHANQLWMLVGFALFEELGKDYRCLEVFPQAIAKTLGTSGIHKLKKAGIEAQLVGIANRTGWQPDDLREELRHCVSGPLHDQVDAYMCAWVASLYPEGLEACGEPPHDAIWIPRLDVALAKEAVSAPISGDTKIWSAPAPTKYSAVVDGAGCQCCRHGVPKFGPRICPICGHQFKGGNWVGIDAHWRSRHQGLMRYEEFWQGLCKDHRG